MRQVMLKDAKKGEYIKRKPDTQTVFIRGDFVRDAGFNKYSLVDFDDVNREIFLKGTTLVWVDFTF